MIAEDVITDTGASHALDMVASLRCAPRCSVCSAICAKQACKEGPNGKGSWRSSGMLINGGGEGSLWDKHFYASFLQVGLCPSCGWEVRYPGIPP